MTPSRSQVDVMREWLATRSAPMPPGGRVVRSRSDGVVLLEIGRRYPGGVSAFLHDHPEEERADG